MSEDEHGQNLEIRPPDYRWPSGDSVPLLAIRPSIEELAERLSLAFYEGVDDLGKYLYAFVEVSEGHMAMLHSYAAALAHGAIIYVDAEASFSSMLALVMEHLALHNAEIRWISPRVQPQNPH